MDINNRLKLILKIAAIITTFVIATLLMQWLFWSVLSMDKTSTSARLILSGVSNLATVILVVYPFLRLDKQNFVSIGLLLKNHRKEFVTGSFIGLLTIASGTLIIWLLGGTRMQLLFPIRIIYVFSGFVMLFFSAFAEEILFRGYILNQLRKLNNRWSAIVISALLFTLIHVLNPDISILSVINIFLAGVVLGIAYLITQNLYFPVGIHLFWNFMQSLFGYSVSGSETPGIFTLEYKEMNLLNGGNFGFEGSYVCTILLMIVIIAFYFYIKNTDHQQTSVFLK